MQYAEYARNHLENIHIKLTNDNIFKILTP
jgi:hypothetical protein